MLVKDNIASAEEAKKEKLVYFTPLVCLSDTSGFCGGHSRKSCQQSHLSNLKTSETEIFTLKTEGIRIVSLQWMHSTFISHESCLAEDS